MIATAANITIAPTAPALPAIESVDESLTVSEPVTAKTRPCVPSTTITATGICHSRWRIRKDGRPEDESTDSKDGTCRDEQGRRRESTVLWGFAHISTL
ncbi:hypothetical protein [Brevibacterium picturae]|uniref:Uncharacterized protein n=1 Tax=Brevibacterium picturae TaxID=260553 RepID=A0ABN2BUV0_9MICO